MLTPRRFLGIDFYVLVSWRPGKAATHRKSVDFWCAKWDRNGTRLKSEKKTPSLLFPARRGRLIKPIELGLELVEPVLRFPPPLRSLGAANPSNGNPARPFPRVLHAGEGCSWSCRIGQKLDMRAIWTPRERAPQWRNRAGLYLEEKGIFGCMREDHTFA